MTNNRSLNPCWTGSLCILYLSHHPNSCHIGLRWSHLPFFELLQVVNNDRPKHRIKPLLLANSSFAVSTLSPIFIPQLLLHIPLFFLRNFSILIPAFSLALSTPKSSSTTNSIIERSTTTIALFSYDLFHCFTHLFLTHFVFSFFLWVVWFDCLVV